MRPTLIRVFRILLVLTWLGDGTARGAERNPGLSRLQEIALAYVESYETVRRFDEYSAKNREQRVSVLTDDAYYEQIFESTAIDVHGALVAAPIEDLEFPGVSFFRVYAATMSPPHPVYVVGVKVNGAILRFRGFDESDFNRMVQGADAAEAASVDRIVRLYYRLHTPFRPGPILDEATLRKVSRALAHAGGAQAKAFLPERQVAPASTALRICVFDEEATRLEVHNLRVDRKGALEVVEKHVLVDGRKITY